MKNLWIVLIGNFLFNIIGLLAFLKYTEVLIFIIVNLMILVALFIFLFGLYYQSQNIEENIKYDLWTSKEIRQHFILINKDKVNGVLKDTTPETTTEK